MKGQKKKVIYISNVNLEGLFLLGVVEKIRGQLFAFRNSEFEIDVLYPRSDGTVIIETNDGQKKIYNGSREKFSGNGIISKAIRHSKVTFFGSINFKYCQEDILKAGYTAVYLRFFLPGSDLIRFLINLKKKSSDTILLLEYPTLNVKTLYQTDLARRVSFFFNQKKINRLNELSDYIITLTRHSELFGKPALFMPNGIALSEIKPVTVPAFTNQLVILGVASDINFYHGFDKVIKGLSLYAKNNSQVKVLLRLISNPLSKNLAELRALARDSGVEELVSFESPKTRAELAAVYQQVHLGMGTLALHRVGLTDNYSLKHREYAAFGLPFIMSKGDFHFEHSPFVLVEERNEEPLDIQRIVTFYTSLRNRYPDYPQEFRKSVEHLITWEAQMKEVFDVINNAQE